MPGSRRFVTPQRSEVQERPGPTFHPQDTALPHAPGVEPTPATNWSRSAASEEQDAFPRATWERGETSLSFDAWRLATGSRRRPSDGISIPREARLILVAGIGPMPGSRRFVTPQRSEVQERPGPTFILRTQRCPTRPASSRRRLPIGPEAQLRRNRMRSHVQLGNEGNHGEKPAARRSTAATPVNCSCRPGIVWS